MAGLLYDANDPDLESWVESANAPGSDFPIQNLPFGRFRRQDDTSWCIGVAIGDQVLDLRKAGLIDHAEMPHLMRLKPETRRPLRQAISEGLRRDSAQRACEKLLSELREDPQRFLKVPREPFYAAISGLQDIFLTSTVEFWHAQGARYQFLPITTTSVSSPMGLGSDSQPFRQRRGERNLVLSSHAAGYCLSAARLGMRDKTKDKPPRITQ